MLALQVIWTGWYSSCDMDTFCGLQERKLSTFYCLSVSFSVCCLSLCLFLFLVSVCVFSVPPVVALLSFGICLCSSLSAFLVRLSVWISSLGLGLRRCLSLTLTVSLSLRLCSFKRKSLGENLGQRSASVRSLVLAAGGGPEGRGWEEEGGRYLVM